VDPGRPGRRRGAVVLRRADVSALDDAQRRAAVAETATAAASGLDPAGAGPLLAAVLFATGPARSCSWPCTTS
jgi:hypothetical protein